MVGDHNPTHSKVFPFLLKKLNENNKTADAIGTNSKYKIDGCGLQIPSLFHLVNFLHF
ncbi:hypothetical protein KP78_28860 [Jeotgalibacillus soli]|uniref:Uncharacterized protein n=1 Tax=Jeotgalibacillus soli TaxID=889306 RepID=A0A0C2V8Q3_9BACL|nr:hypothetical protein KP78_28860 [Jeotgalibacillus soli]